MGIENAGEAFVETISVVDEFVVAEAVEDGGVPIGNPALG